MANVSQKAHSKLRPSPAPQENAAKSNGGWMSKLTIEYLVDPQYVFHRPTGKEAMAPAAWNKKLHYPLDIGDWTWLHVLSLVFPDTAIEVRTLYGLLFRRQVCVKLEIDPTTKGPVNMYVPESFLKELRKMSSKECVDEVMRFLDKLPTEEEYNELVKNNTEVKEFIAHHIYNPRTHDTLSFPLDVADDMASTYAFHIYAHEYNMRKNPATGTYTMSRVTSETFPSSVAAAPVTADGTACTPTQLMTAFLNRVTNHKLVVGGDGKDERKKSAKGGEDGGDSERKIVLSPRNGDVTQDVKYGKRRVTGISYVPQTMMYFRGGLVYQAFNANTNTYTRTAANPAEHIVFNSLDANSRLGTEISSLCIDKNFGFPTGVAIALLLLEFACGPDHALVLRGSSKIMTRPDPSLKVIIKACKKLCVTIFSYRDGYESFATLQTRFVTQFSSAGATSESTPAFNWFVTTEQQREYLSLPPQDRPRARVLLARAAMMPKIMDAGGKTRFTAIWTPTTIGKNVDDIFKGVCLLNFSFFTHQNEVHVRATVGPVICAKAAPAYTRVVEGIDNLDMPLPPSIAEAMNASADADEDAGDGEFEANSEASPLACAPSSEGEDIARRDEREPSENDCNEGEEEEEGEDEEERTEERDDNDDQEHDDDANESYSSPLRLIAPPVSPPKKRPGSANHGADAKRSKKINL